MLLKLCSRLDRRRFTPSVLSLCAEGTLRPRFEALGVPVYDAGMRRGRLSARGMLTLRRQILMLRPDLVQGWMYHGNLAAMLLARKLPVVMGIRQSLYQLENESLLTRCTIRLGAWLSHYAASIVYNSHMSARQHEAFGFSSARRLVIPNGFDTESYCPHPGNRQAVRQELRIHSDMVLIGLIGRYHPMKDHGTFLSAAALLSQRFPMVRFLMAGTSVDATNNKLVNRIEQLGLSQRVLLLGERNDMPRVNAALDIASSTSAWGEGFANAVGEAMSCGVPCVVTDIGDSAWIVGDTGRVVTPRNAEVIAQAWSELIELGRSGREELGRQARRRIMDAFALGSVVRRYEELYEKLITRSEVATCAE